MLGWMCFIAFFIAIIKGTIESLRRDGGLINQFKKGAQSKRWRFEMVIACMPLVLLLFRQWVAGVIGAVIAVIIVFIIEVVVMLRNDS